jgi:hypothetical protein
MTWGGHEPVQKQGYILKINWREKYELEELLKSQIDIVESVIAFLEEKEKDTTILKEDLEIYKKLLKKLEEVK